MRALILLLSILALAACSSAPTRNASAYRDYVEIIRKDAADNAKTAAAERDKRAREFDVLASKCTNDACVQQLAAFKSVTEIATAAIGGQARGAAQPLPAPPRERDWAEKFHDVVIGITPLATGLGNAAVTWHQSDNSVKQTAQQYQFYGTAFGAMRDVAQSAQPNITVGGDYVTGTQHTGDTVTGDGNATRGSSIHNGDAIAGDGNATHGSQVGDNAGRDQTGGDHQDGSVVGDGNRIESPGPFDNVGNGGDCGNAGNGAPAGNGGGDGSPAGGSGGTGGNCAGGVGGQGG